MHDVRLKLQFLGRKRERGSGSANVAAEIAREEKSGQCKVIISLVLGSLLDTPHRSVEPITIILSTPAKISAPYYVG
jgi:hypothetical protein